MSASMLCRLGRRVPLLRLAGPLLVVLLAIPAASRGQVGGVSFDAGGVVRLAPPLSPAELQLARQRLAEPSPRVARESPCRVISLRRLESALSEHLERMGPEGWDQLPPDLRYLAGLNRIDWVLVRPGQSDVWLAGPAGAWESDDTGNPLASRGGRPPLELDDLLVAVRYAFPVGETDDFIGCSIDPTPEGLAAVERLLQRQRRVDAASSGTLARSLEQAAGPQAITLFGVAGETRFAQKLVSADYRLKRLALGHDPAPVPGWRNSLDLLAQRGAGRVPQQRWWFAPSATALRVSPERDAWRIDPEPLEIATARRSAAGEPDTPATREARQFAELATRLLPEVAARVPIFAELQNLLALALAAEITREAAGRSANAWQPDLLRDSRRCPTRRVAVPRSTPPLAQVRPGAKGAWISTVSGGVEFRPDTLVSEARELAGTETRPPVADPPPSAADWWWEATPDPTGTN
jgi:hypothetical protein